MGANWDYACAKNIFEENRKVTPSYAGITYERLEKRAYPVAMPHRRASGTQFLHKDKFNRDWTHVCHRVYTSGRGC
jgi:predicted molibdopterin-dependent oxidoreductase YjgC